MAFGAGIVVALWINPSMLLILVYLVTFPKMISTVEATGNFILNHSFDFLPIPPTPPKNEMQEN